MGLSRNKVAVPEGAAGTPPFWSGTVLTVSAVAISLVRPVLFNWPNKIDEREVFKPGFYVLVVGLTVL